VAGMAEAIRRCLGSVAGECAGRKIVAGIPVLK
jgi:hypothetical protein